MKEKIYQLAQEILDKANQTTKSDEEFRKMSEAQKSRYLQEQNFINGQLSTINKVIELIRGE